MNDRTQFQNTAESLWENTKEVTSPSGKHYLIRKMTGMDLLECGLDPVALAPEVAIPAEVPESEIPRYREMIEARMRKALSKDPGRPAKIMRSVLVAAVLAPGLYLGPVPPEKPETPGPVPVDLLGPDAAWVFNEIMEFAGMRAANGASASGVRFREDGGRPIPDEAGEAAGSPPQPVADGQT